MFRRGSRKTLPIYPSCAIADFLSWKDAIRATRRRATPIRGARREARRHGFVPPPAWSGESRSGESAGGDDVSDAHDLDALVGREVLADRGLGQEGLAVHHAHGREQEVLRHQENLRSIVPAAIPQVRRNRQRADEDESRDHDSVASAKH